jgi:hypothetical protein
MDGDGGPGGAGDPWWEAVDAAADPPMLTEIQRRGRQATGQLVERFLRQADRGSTTDLVAELFRTALRTAAPMARTTGDGSAQRTAQGPVRLMIRSPGPRRVDIWLHNTTPQDWRALRPRCGQLIDHTGRVLRAAVAFQPEVVDLLVAGTSRRVTVTAHDADAADPPGLFRGMILVAGAPDAWLPIEVEVAA